MIMSVSGMQFVCVLSSLIATCVLVVALLHGEWTTTTFDYAAIERRVNNTHLAYKWVTHSPPFAVLWDRREAKDNHNECLDGDGLQLQHNATVLMDENANVYRVCRKYWDAGSQSLLEAALSTRLHFPLNATCVHYFDEYMEDSAALDEYCVNRCCTFPASHREQLVIAELSAHEAIFTVFSCVIVAFILLVSSVFLLGVRFVGIGSIILVRLGGATFGLTGLYVAFAFAITLYETSNMYRMKSLGYLPAEALQHRYVSLGTGSYIALAASIICFITSLFWLVLSCTLVHTERYGVSKDSTSMFRAKQENRVHAQSNGAVNSGYVAEINR